jgi:demethylmenaquinone methyltransferase/2-methoxy-6-polyprenyl-1,4-benzoquinol methylase
MADMNRRIEAFFDKLAPTWHADVALPYVERLGAIVDGLGIAEGATVLDVGAGTGILAAELVGRVGPAGLVVSVDLSRAMLREGKALYPDARIAWVQADVLDAPFRTAAFDWVICYSVFPHFLDQQRAVNGFAALLKAGGRLAVLHSQSREAINAHHEKVGDVVGGHKLPDDPAMTRLLQNAGLVLMRLENSEERFIALAESRGHST